MPAAEQFLWSNHTMLTCGIWMEATVGRLACFPIRLLKIILISFSKAAKHTWCIVGSRSGNVTFSVTWWIREMYQFCPNLLTTTDFTSWRQIAVGQNWASVLHWDTHFKKMLFKVAVELWPISAYSVKSRQMMLMVSSSMILPLYKMFV